MQSPVSLVAILRPTTRGDLLGATAFSALVFTATPFLLPVVAEHYGVSLGLASLISTAQLLGFVLATSLAPRATRPSHRLLVGALLTAATTNTLSAITPWFAGLLALRLVDGLALGTIAWLGWQEVFGDEERMGDIAVIGPVIGIVGAPLAGLLADAGGDDAVFITLALLAVAPLPFTWGRPELVDRGPGRRRRSRPIPITRVILTCLGLFTMGGSAVFVFAAAIGGERLGIEPLVLSLAFSANAALGIPPARYRGARPLAGLWMLVTAMTAIVVSITGHGVVWWLSIAVWGFAFWAGVPGAFTLLAERSVHPVDRAGDAQAVMAAGRVVGPIVGGLLVEAGSFTALGLGAGAIMGMASLTLVAIERRVPPRDPLTQAT